MATADLTILALGRPDPSASAYVAEIQRHLARQDKVRYEMHAMGTSLEGRTEDILAVVGWLHDIPFELGAPRVYTVLKLDERRDKPGQTLADKVASVEARLAADPPQPGPSPDLQARARIRRGAWREEARVQAGAAGPDSGHGQGRRVRPRQGTPRRRARGVGSLP